MNQNDLGDFYKIKLKQGFFTENQINNIINDINTLGYISQQTGDYIDNLFDDNYDIYLKTVHSTDLASISYYGIYCNGTSTSGFGSIPSSVSDINFGNTMTKVDNRIDLVRIIKNAYGYSQGGNPIDGTLIIKIPKNTSKNGIAYYNYNNNIFCIRPEYIDGFIGVDQNHIVSDVIRQ